MFGGKGNYSRSVYIAKKVKEKNKHLAKKIKNAESRYKKHKEEMREVDLADILKRYAPNAKQYQDDYKIKYSDENSDYVVVADLSGYLRVLDTRTNTFVDVVSGVTMKKSDKDYNKKTHFKIKRRKE